MRIGTFALLCLGSMPLLAQETLEAPMAPEPSVRLIFEAGLVGGNSVACPGEYVGIEGRVAGPVSVYGMVETYRCADFAGSANRIGASVRLGSSDWLVRPALRAGVEYDGGDTSPTAGLSLTFGRRHGARLMAHHGEVSGGKDILLFQMGAYFSFGGHRKQGATGR
ncbi:MAG: hypothetical protein OXH70_10935 [Acidobacteria bacterium]|nr:hypothetical protein [Acidobacteriota bacterium]